MPLNVWNPIILSFLSALPTYTFCSSSHVSQPMCYVGSPKLRPMLLLSGPSSRSPWPRLVKPMRPNRR
ncbi:uncharacterized protein METZ01_LOCUS110963 [marine metagenome]|uniref:Uncharacterized protein n=1 Tax=marine metagenome TaxID=408172 RepID=A0A381WZZ6_9ZZZZ